MKAYKKPKKKLYAFILVIFFGVLSFYFDFFPTHVLTAFSSYATYPILVVHSFTIKPIHQWATKRHTIKELTAQLEKQKKEIEQLYAENIAVRSSLNYALDIHELHEYKNRYQTHNKIISRILVHHESPREHYILINGGSNKGIKKDMVAVYENNLLGKVSHVYPWYTKVMLITDANCKVAAFCEQSKARGIHQGANQSQTTLHHVSHLQHVQLGELVLSSGKGLIFPHGFALGKVKYVQKKGLTQQIGVVPFIDVSTLNYCTIIDKSQL